MALLPQNRGSNATKQRLRSARADSAVRASGRSNGLPGSRPAMAAATA
ncbi:hypothetical protein (plasmid) [Streptomyces leeuwenhoekii]|uniref:Uncharacterized protein n=1 Tax=Streptomyces leeuwenhoekii TaxID=1437453 RepID=A0A0F7VLC3_STRLW|nr:hypothetical protein [Streptomyces leeuwenhoekii]